jgi:hypothetical protein
LRTQASGLSPLSEDGEEQRLGSPADGTDSSKNLSEGERNSYTSSILPRCARQLQKREEEAKIVLSMTP